MANWETRRALIVVRTYPTPAHSGVEVSCTAAITEDGKWLRLFPVPHRFMDPDKRFRKYWWVRLNVQKATSDARPESYKLDPDSIVSDSFVRPDHQWRDRKLIIYDLKKRSMCEIERERESKGSPTLGIFRPGRIKRLRLEPIGEDWNAQQKNILNQELLPFISSPSEKLEKIPYNFRYEYVCEDASCNGHRMICTDWEMGQAYRNWRSTYGDGWEAKFRQRFEEEMINKYDTHFFVGTLHKHPSTWIIVGLYYPPRTTTPSLFDA